jgi:serine/threonine protein kinase
LEKSLLAKRGSLSHHHLPEPEDAQQTMARTKDEDEKEPDGSGHGRGSGPGPRPKSEIEIVVQCLFPSMRCARMIGEGTYGSVFLFEDRLTGERVVLKRTPKGCPCGTVERRVLRTLRHPNVIRLLAALETKRSTYLVLEHAGGGDLFQRITAEGGRGTKREAFARGVMRGLLRALAHAHRAGVVHHDVKPENILLRSNGEVALADFGLADEWAPFQRSRTACGSLQYLPPEVLGTDEPEYGPECDVYSAGVVLYVMLTKRHPFKGSSARELFRDMLERGVPPIPDASAAVQRFLSRLMALMPLQRPSAAEALRDPWMRRPDVDVDVGGENLALVGGEGAG